MRKCKLSILTMIMFMLLTLLIPMQSTYAVEKTRSFVLDFMPEYTTEYKSLLDYLENEAYKKLTEVSGDKDDTFLPEKAYPAFFLSGALTADGNIDVKPDSMRWIVPTIKNKYMSIMRDGDSFRFLGLFVPDDPDWMSPHMIDLDAIKEIIESNKTTLSLGSFTFIIANEYNFV